MERQRFINVYGNIYDLQIIDEWATLYTDEEIFWKSQYFRSYAKEMLDIAMALDTDNINSDSWLLADFAEAIARVLEGSLCIKP